MKYTCRVLRNNPMAHSLALEETIFFIKADNDQSAKDKAQNMANRYYISSIRLVKKVEVKINGEWIDAYKEVK